MTQFGVILYYLRLVVLPVGQTFDYDWPLARTPFALGVLAAAVAAGRAGRPRRCARRGPAAVHLCRRLDAADPRADLVDACRSPISPSSAACTCRSPASCCWPPPGCAISCSGCRAGLRDRRPERDVRRDSSRVLLARRQRAHADHRARCCGAMPIALHEDGVAKAPGNPRVRLNLGVTYLNLRSAGTSLRHAARWPSGSTIGRNRCNAFRASARSSTTTSAPCCSRARTSTAPSRAAALAGARRPVSGAAPDGLHAAQPHRGAARRLDEGRQRHGRGAEVPGQSGLARRPRRRCIGRAGNIPGARATLLNLLKAHPGNPRATALLAQIDKEKAAGKKGK